MIIDRFEDGFAVIEDDNGVFFSVNIEKIPKDAAEGDCIFFKNGVYLLDEDKTKERRSEILRLQNGLWE